MASGHLGNMRRKELSYWLRARFLRMAIHQGWSAKGEHSPIGAYATPLFEPGSGVKLPTQNKSRRAKKPHLGGGTGIS
jgi:hypothetical protein